MWLLLTLLHTLLLTQCRYVALADTAASATQRDPKGTRVRVKCRRSRNSIIDIIGPYNQNGTGLLLYIGVPSAVASLNSRMVECSYAGNGFAARRIGGTSPRISRLHSIGCRAPKHSGWLRGLGGHLMGGLGAWVAWGPGWLGGHLPLGGVCKEGLSRQKTLECLQTHECVCG